MKEPVKARDDIFVVQVTYQNGDILTFTVPKDIPLERAHELFCDTPFGSQKIRRIEFADPICQQTKAARGTSNIVIARRETITKIDNLRSVTYAVMSDVSVADSASPARREDERDLRLWQWLTVWRR